MQISKVSEYQGFCIPQDSIKSQSNPENLNCIICFQIMTTPAKLSCKAGHTFGLACIKQWNKNKPSVKCPCCRQIISTYTINKPVKQDIQKLVSVCQYCKNWQGSVQKLASHQDDCQAFNDFLNNQLQKTVQEQLNLLNLQINPHLKNQHLEIFENHVQNWIWLKSDLRDWKWFWWASNPWWNGSCPQCNILWHRYENKIDPLEVKRIDIIKRTRRCLIYAINDLFQTQNY